MPNKSEKKSITNTKRKNSKMANPIPTAADTNMEKPVRGLPKK